MAINDFISSYSKDEITDPLLLEFLDAVGGQGYIDCEVLQSKDFMKYWPNISIHRYEDEDFTYIHFGTQLVEHMKCERTGKRVLELTDHPRKEVLFDALMEVHKNKKPMYTVGNLKIDGREHKQWQQVKMPMQRNGGMNEVLSFIAYKPYEN